MQDLLNEQEFLKKKYNPWKLFYTFYAIAFIQLVLFLVVVSVSDKPGFRTGLTAFLLANITAMAMFFFNKKNALLPVKTIGLGTGILFAVYSVPLAIMSLFGGTPVSSALGFLFLALADFLICFFIMVLVAKSKQNKTSANP